MAGFLPVSRADMEARGWDQCDFVYIIGDAYVDHPTFGHAIISRVLESRGYRVGIIPQPDWKDPESIRVLHLDPGPSAPGLSGHGRQHGSHGQPLYRLQTPEKL